MRFNILLGYPNVKSFEMSLKFSWAR